MQRASRMEAASDGPLPPEFFAGPDATTTGVTIREIFRCFNRARDGALSREQYSRFCQATEGAGCDEKRWAQHCKALGVVDAGAGMPIGHFGKLYTQKRFKKHFGKGRSELQKVNQFLAAPREQPEAGAAGSGAGSAETGGGGGGGGSVAAAAAAAGANAAAEPDGKPRPPSRRSVLRVGAASRVRTVAFTAPGLLGIQWGPEVTLKPADSAREVLGELQATAAAAADGGGSGRDANKSAIASRGDLHPNAARHGQPAGATPPRGFAAFEPSATFDGARPGYQFQLGSMGLGYYWYGGAAGQAAVEAAKQAQRSNRGSDSDTDSESDDEDDDETEYGCAILGLKPGSYAERLAAQAEAGAALRVGMVLKRVNDWTTDGRETDDIIDEIAKQPRSETTPLMLSFAPQATAAEPDRSQRGEHTAAATDPQQGTQTVERGGDREAQGGAAGSKRRRLLKWADEDGTGSNVAEEVPTIDMFGGDGDGGGGGGGPAPAAAAAAAAAAASGRGGGGVGGAAKAVPFHLRQAAERAAFAAVQEQARAKRARLETVRTIHSRHEMRAAEAAAYAEEQRQEQAKADAETNAALHAEAAGPKKWCAKNERLRLSRGHFHLKNDHLPRRTPDKRRASPKRNRRACVCVFPIIQGA